MFVYYFTDDTSKINDISLPPSNASNMEVAVSDCYLKAVSVNDYPCFDDYGNELNEIEAIYGEKLLEKYLDQLSQINAQKAGDGHALYNQPIIHYVNVVRRKRLSSS